MIFDNDLFTLKIKATLTNAKNNFIIFLVLIIMRLIVRDSSVQTLLSFAIVIDVVLAIVGIVSKPEETEGKTQKETMDVEVEHNTQAEQPVHKKRAIRKIKNKVTVQSEPPTSSPEPPTPQSQEIDFGAVETPKQPEAATDTNTQSPPPEAVTHVDPSPIPDDDSSEGTDAVSDSIIDSFWESLL